MKLIAGLLAGTIHRAVPVSAGGKLAARTTFGIAIRSTTAAQSILYVVCLCPHCLCTDVLNIAEVLYVK